MPNALKAPAPSPFIDEAHDPAEEKKSNQKKFVIGLFLVLLLGLAIGLYTSQEEPLESTVESLKIPPAAPSKYQEPKPEPRASTVEKAKQVGESSKAQLLPQKADPLTQKDEKSEYSFKKDKEYLAINRYERPSLNPRLAKTPTERVRDTVSVVDKPLALAGRGFDIKEFPSQYGKGIEASYLRHLKKPVPKIDRVVPDPLDLQLSQAKSSKDLIFHPLRPALSQLPDPPQWEDPEISGKHSPDLETVPETKLLFKENANSELILRPGKESLDLMIGNEKINRKKYDNW